VTNHRLVLTETLDELECLTCDFMMPLPRGAPQEPSKRLEWAEAVGVLPHQEGRSVAFLEALRGVG
jgi:hypothetical protein